MDIAAMSMSLNQVQIKEQASISITKMAMDSAQGQEEALDKLLEASTKTLEHAVEPYIGSNIDLHLKEKRVEVFCSKPGSDPSGSSGRKHISLYPGKKRYMFFLRY